MINGCSIQYFGPFRDTVPNHIGFSSWKTWFYLRFPDSSTNIVVMTGISVWEILSNFCFSHPSHGTSKILAPVLKLEIILHYRVEHAAAVRAMVCILTSSKFSLQVFECWWNACIVMGKNVFLISALNCKQVRSTLGEKGRLLMIFYGIALCAIHSVARHYFSSRNTVRCIWKRRVVFF